MRIPALSWEIILSVTNVLSAVVVAGFAWAQWQLTKRNENTRRLERHDDNAAAVDAAYAAVHAEWFRIWAVSHQWQQGDLLAWAEGDQVSPEAMLPRDWGTATQNLGRLGYMASYLGSFGFALAHDAAKLAAGFVDNVKTYRDSAPTSPRELAAFEAQYLPQLRDMESQLKALASEAANLLQDALEHSPNATLGRTVRFNERLHSQRARELAKTLQSQQATGSLPEAAKDFYAGEGK